MKILHVTPHLGGGVGKAHAALRGALPDDIEQTFLLLEQPRDRRYADAIESGGARVVVSRDLDDVASLASAADIVQFEFWNHPRLFECLARCKFAPMRSVFWSHISGLHKPVIQPGLIEQAGRFVLTTQASLANPALAAMSTTITVINSGFGFANTHKRVPARHQTPVIAYLGTVDFAKMHPGFFDCLDRLSGDAIHVCVWGEVDPAVAARAQAMRHPERIEFCGHTARPDLALAGADIFFYPLQPDHYGTAENALVEAMSMGLVPVVLSNPAEMAIVRDHETGFVAHSIEECASILQALLLSPRLRDKVAGMAARHVALWHAPVRAAQQFVDLWQDLLSEAPRQPGFRDAIGQDPADWLVATQCLPGETWPSTRRAGRETASKGSLAHFEHVFAGDASLSRLRLQTA